MRKLLIAGVFLILVGCAYEYRYRYSVEVERSRKFIKNPCDSVVVKTKKR